MSKKKNPTPAVVRISRETHKALRARATIEQRNPGAVADRMLRLALDAEREADVRRAEESASDPH